MEHTPSPAIASPHWFTPLSGEAEQRYEWKLSSADMAKISRSLCHRGHPWTATVTNLVDDRRYLVRGVSCGRSWCYCDAAVTGELIAETEGPQTQGPGQEEEIKR